MSRLQFLLARPANKTPLRGLVGVIGRVFLLVSLLLPMLQLRQAPIQAIEFSGEIAQSSSGATTRNVAVEGTVSSTTCFEESLVGWQTTI